MEETTSRGQVSRRTIAKGMAWAAPAIPVVAMAPKAAASTECAPFFSGDACKQPGQSGTTSFYFKIQVCWPDGCGGSQGVTDVRVYQTGAGGLNWTPTIGPDGCSPLLDGQSTNSSTIKVDYTLNGVEYTNVNLGKLPEKDTCLPPA